MLNCYTKVPYKDLDKYLKVVLPSTHCAWFCYMDDSDFITAMKELFDKPITPELQKMQEENNIFREAYDMLKTKYD